MKLENEIKILKANEIKLMQDLLYQQQTTKKALLDLEMITQGDYKHIVLFFFTNRMSAKMYM